MSKTAGHILVIPEGLETQAIPQSERDQTVRDFLDMKSVAERDGDQVYADNDIYSHDYSYGNIFTDLIYISWPALLQKETLKGISQNTHQLITRISQHPGFLPCSDPKNFLSSHNHATQAGFKIPMPPHPYIYDDSTRLQWHEKWYSEHPEKIIWPGQGNIFPCPDKIIQILKRELSKHNIAIPQTDDDIVSSFHEEVMKHKGPDIHAYAGEIGAEICFCNYYKEEIVLSRLEERRNGSFRKIFSILSKQGKRQFLSIDFKHGMFEFLDHTGTHIGEYKYDGSHHKDAQPEDHSLLCMKEWVQQGCP